MFSTPKQNLFHVTFLSGITVSVAFHSGSYSAGQDHNYPPKEKAASEHAEVGMFRDDMEWVRPPEGFIPGAFEHDDVAGWLSPDEVLKLMVWAESGGDGARPSVLG